MRYAEHAPIPALAHVVECVWTLDGHARDLADATQPVLPDGRAELIVHFGDPFDRLDDGHADRQPPLIFAGQLTRRLVLQPTGRVTVLGVRFRPNGANAFVPAPLRDFVGATIDVADASPSLAQAARRVQDAGTLDRAVPLIQTLLAASAPLALDRRVAHAVQAIDATRGMIAIDSLARTTGTTRRHLERLFLDHVGISPKRLARLTRFQRAVAVLEHETVGPRGVVTAHACGYADQAHFVRDFRELAGCTPNAHLLQRAELTGFFVGRTV
jgi:AraC-like DNA-binding protein